MHVTLLRAVATFIVAAVFLAAGVMKLHTGDPGGTMVSRYFQGADGARAVGCIEVGLALWLISLRTPRLAGLVATIALLALSAAIGLELNRERPLPCGCLEARPGMDPFVVRHGLWLSLARNGFLIVMALLTVALSPSEQASRAE
jgi:hypothetical protein